MPKYGPFNREGNIRTQPDELAIEQVRSGEVWGRTPVQKGGWPVVESYTGLLGNGDWGINFTTEIEPHPGSAPHHAKWHFGKTPGVELREKNGEDYGCIAAALTRVPPPKLRAK